MRAYGRGTRDARTCASRPVNRHPMRLIFHVGARGAIIKSEHTNNVRRTQGARLIEGRRPPVHVAARVSQNFDGQVPI